MATEMMMKITYRITPTSAPLPHDLERRGRVSFHTRNRIRPTSGIKNPKNAHPKLLPSTGAFAEYAGGALLRRDVVLRRAAVGAVGLVVADLFSAFFTKHFLYPPD